MRRISLVSKFLLVFFANIVLASEIQYNNTFIQPPGSQGSSDYSGNVVLTEGTNTTIQWNTSVSDYNIYLWQQIPHQGAADQLGQIYPPVGGSANPGIQKFTWNVTLYGSNLTYNNIYFLWLNHNSPSGFTSHYFNITKGVSTGSTTSASSTISATSTSSSTSSPSSSSSSSSDATKIGLGVGLGVGIPLILIAAALLGLLLFRRRRSSQSQNGGVLSTATPMTQYTGTGASTPFDASKSKDYPYQAAGNHEAAAPAYEANSGPTSPRELDGQSRNALFELQSTSER